MKQYPTQEELKNLFEYSCGNLFWKADRHKNKKGSKAGHENNYGYECVCINYQRYQTHRLIFLFHHGLLPDLIDHIDGDRKNNRIENLRPCTKSQNNMNSLGKTGNSSKYKGVCFVKNRGKWMCTIGFNKKRITFCGFDTEEEAAICYNENVVKYHGDFAKLNIIK